MSFKEEGRGIECDSEESGRDQYLELDLSNGEDMPATDLEPTADIQPPVPPAPVPPALEQQPLRRSGRERHFPDYYGIRVYVCKTEPTTVEEVLSTPEKDHWYQAMEKEMKSLKDNDVWELVELPKGRKAVGSKCVFKAKTDSDRYVERLKARLVAQGFSQKFGLDYDETFCPVVRLESVRALIALSVQQGLQLHQVDVTTTFLNGQLEEEVYMEQPDGFVAPGNEHFVCRLKKSIYSLKQSPRCWNFVLDSHLKEMGLIQMAADPCVYRATEGEQVYLGVYVDDIIVAAQSNEKLAEVKNRLVMF